VDTELQNLKRKVDRYQEILANTKAYRQVWLEDLSQQILDQLNYIMGQMELEATVEVIAELENLEAIKLSLGTVHSGMSHRVNETIQRDLIKHSGALVYQQLFNGKVMVNIQYPYIEGYGDPTPPKTIAIYRPEELKTHYFIRHVEELIHEVTLWEDYDDDEPHQQRIGFQLNFEPQEE
jgi:hypothetical protein